MLPHVQRNNQSISSSQLDRPISTINLRFLTVEAQLHPVFLSLTTNEAAVLDCVGLSVREMFLVYFLHFD